MRRPAVLLGATIAFGALYLAATTVLGTTPGPEDGGRRVVEWFASRGSQVRWWLWLLTLAIPFFAVFVALVRNVLPTPHRDVFFFGAVAFAAETAVQGWFWAGMAWHAARLAPSTARTLLDIAGFWGPVLNAATVTMLVPVVLASLTRDPPVVPKWVGAVYGVAAAEQAVETVTVFGRDGFLAPGGPMNIYLGAGLVGVALLCVGVTASRGRASAPASAPL